MALNQFFLRISFVFLILFTLFSCQSKDKVQQEAELISVKTTLERFDQIFYQTSVENFNKLRADFPHFFPSHISDSIYIQKLQLPIYRELFDEVQMSFPDFNDKQTEIETLLKYIKFYFPNRQTPNKITTLISEMDYESKAIYTDSLIIVSLDLYLGNQHRFYVSEFPKYLVDTFIPEQILPDIAESFAFANVPQPIDKTLLSQMIYKGKIMYLKESILPEEEDHTIIGYLPEQIQWCQENELEMWRFFMDQNMLYSVETKNSARFIELAPFSKFYLDIDQESPGRVGVWMGWQIIRAFMKNNEKVTLSELLTLEPKYIFENSKYKPRK
jgi:gliding motility-associated lipoprotein GldB